MRASAAGLVAGIVLLAAVGVPAGAEHSAAECVKVPSAPREACRVVHDAVGALPVRPMHGGNDAFTVLLIHADGPDGSKAFTDASASAHGLSARANAKMTGVQAKFGGSAAHFDGFGTEGGDGTCLQVSDHSDFHFAAQDFTIDAWVHRATAGSVTVFNQHALGPAQAVSFGVDGSGSMWFSWHVSGNPDHRPIYVTTPAGTVTAEAWHHLAVVRAGDTFTLYLDGEFVAGQTAALSLPDIAGVVAIGCNRWDGIFKGASKGLIDELRVSKGIARWKAPFFPPNAPYGEGLYQEPLPKL